MILERLMLEDFARGDFLHGAPSQGREGIDDFRALFLMQHYGVPTRLLDWTGNPFIALYFALTSAERRSKTGRQNADAAVWVLDPVSWNSHALADVSWGLEGPLALTSDEARPYYPCKVYKGRKLEDNAIKKLYERPVAFLGAVNNARMFAQRGVFTLFGKDMAPMETQYDEGGFPEGCLAKIVIPKLKISSIAERLRQIGYTDSVSYPDLHGLAMEIKVSRGFGV